MPVENASDKWIAVFEGGASAPSIAVAQAAADAAEGFASDAAASAATASSALGDIETARVDALDAIAAVLPETASPYPMFGLEDQRDAEIADDGTIMARVTRDGRVVETRKQVAEGMGDGVAPVTAHVTASGDLKIITGHDSVTTVPAAANWPGGGTRRFTPTGYAHGRAIVATDMPLILPYSTRMAGTGGLAPMPDPNLCLIVCGDGQSLMSGQNAVWDTASPKQMWGTPRREIPANIWMPTYNGAADVRGRRRGDWGAGVNPANGIVNAAALNGFTPLTPRALPEGSGWVTSPLAETPLERAACVISDGIYAATGWRPMIVVVNIGFGGVPIEHMAKTGAANIPGYTVTKYANDQAYLARVRDLLVAMGKKPVMPWVFWKHGETSSADAAYRANRLAVMNPFTADIMALFGQAAAPHYIEHITSGVGGGVLTRSSTAIVEMHRAGELHIAGPDYMLLGRDGFVVTGVPSPPVRDYTHLTARGSAIVGEEMGLVALSLFMRNIRPTAVLPTSVVASGSSIDVTFASPSGTIEIAGSPGFPVPTHAGFLYTDTHGGTVPTITGAAVIAPNTVRLSMSASVTGRSGRSVSCAHNYTATGTAAGKSRSTVRDPVSLGTSVVDGAARYAWAIPFSDPVTGA